MAVAEPIEQNVEEVHCVDCGVPMPSIPGWYAGVNVRFSCDACRQKSPRLNALPAVDSAPLRSAVVADTDAEPILEDADLEADAVEDIDVDVDDSDIADTDEV
jgi:hypothetical protein